MNRKPFTVRQFVLIGVAVVTGTGLGSAAEAVLADTGGHPAGPVVATMAALWVLDRLDRLIDDRDA